ncbi:hypothetical protein A4X03_0g3887 [Tilletia caries]|uniref:Uncharacterized protein n=3 Tax=Tilletia TaxID=13289 RepID=A0A177V773_9BASI|nr:hypothetical protein CF335_g6655 [Tilletia laevis]KAE8260171.1 hypothetical protein A4X03_0g3887 [Tilletia caries]
MRSVIVHVRTAKSILATLPAPSSQLPAAFFSLPKGPSPSSRPSHSPSQFPGAAERMMADRARTPAHQKQTIIHSPFFRPEIISAYARDALQAEHYPLSHAALLFQPEAKDVDTNGTSALSPANIQALQNASQALASHLVLVDRESQKGSSAAEIVQHKLQAAQLRSHLAVTLMLLNQHTRALAQLNFASDSLRPPRSSRNQEDKAGGTEQAPPPPPSSTVDVDKTRITLWILTEKACLALGKDHEAARVQRWRTALELKLTSNG